MSNKKVIAVLCVFAVLAFCACAPSGAPTPEVTASEEVTQMPENSADTGLSLPEWNYQYIKSGDAQYDYNRAEQYVPMWYTNVIYNECCCFVQDGDSITAKLKFKPKRIISVRDWSLEKEYTEGVDYTFDAETNTFTWLEGSSVPYFTQNLLHGKYENGEPIDAFAGYDQAPWSTLGYARWENAFYCIGPELYEKQMFVTYEYDTADFTGPVQEFAGEKLPNTMSKLLKGEALSVLFYGDSIPVGCDASGMYNRKPNQDEFPKIFRKALQEIYGSTVKYRNTAVGGTTTDWANQNVESQVIKYKPDLVVLMTGGNDGNNTVNTKTNILAAVKKIKAALPECEIILMDTFVGNADGGFDTKVKPMLKGIHDDIAVANEGVVSVGIYDLHNYFLQGKNYIDFSGNGINHPNDYMIRIYAQQLLSAVVDFKSLSQRDSG